jgi:DNA-binding response OmpR family regulator
LSVSNQALRRQSEVPGTNGAATPRRVLIVDDEPAIRRLLCDLFKSEGYLVSQAADGARALEQLRLVRPNIVVVDMMMPVMNGLEFVTECRRIEGCGDLPIILLSAMYENVRTASRLPRMGINACLGKPFSVQELLAVVALHERRTSEQPIAMRLEAGPVRVLLMLDRPIVARMVRLTLNHGAYVTRTVTNSPDAVEAVATWQPHLVLLDMALADAALMDRIGVPIIGLTRSCDLKSSLAAFEAGVDDLLTLPFAPEELLARVIGVVRYCYRDTVAFTRVIDIG